MSAVARLEEPGLPGIPEPEAPRSMMDSILHAAKDPNIDAQKVHQLLEAYERLQGWQAKREYTAAMLKLKPRLPVIEKNGKIIITDKNDRTKVIQSTPYALWEDVDEQITPLLVEHGFTLTFRTDTTAENRISVTAVLEHVGGHSERSTMSLPADTSGSKNNVQALGSSFSYGKRYMAFALLNIRTKGQDDDGTAGGESILNSEQVEHVFDCAKRAGKTAEGICQWLKMPEGSGIPDIQQKEYDRVIRALNEAARPKVKK